MNEDEYLSDIVNFRWLLLKPDFRILCFELENLINKFVKLFSNFFQKNNNKQICRVLFSLKELSYFLTGTLKHNKAIKDTLTNNNFQRDE